MIRHLTFSQLTLLVGVAFAVAGVLIVLLYVLHKTVRRQLHEEGLKAPAPRAENSQAFALATLQGVIASVREEQKKTANLLRVSELRAEESARKAELIAREIEEGLVIFDGQGFISLANPASHALLEIDIWSRRRYQEVLGAGSELARRVESCLTNGTVTRGEALDYQTPGGRTLRLIVTIVPLTRQLTGGEEILGAVCLVKRA
jgi:PAS domain-containing protein